MVDGEIILYVLVIPDTTTAFSANAAVTAYEDETAFFDVPEKVEPIDDV